MDLLTGSNDLGTLGLGLLITSAAAGLFSGVLGRGAGLTLVPLMFLVLREAGVTAGPALHLAIGTSFACLIPLAAATAYRKRVDLGLFRRWVPPMVLGAAGGITLNLLAPVGVLALAFAAAALLAVVLTVAVQAPRERGVAAGVGAVMAAVQGACSMAFGLGGGSLAVPMLMLNGTPRDIAQNTAGLIALVIAIAGTIFAVAAGWAAPGLPEYSYGYVNLAVFAVATPALLGIAILTRALGDAIDAKRLRLLFALFVVLTTAKMVWSVVA